jgi:hypothetical protein
MKRSITSSGTSSFGRSRNVSSKALDNVSLQNIKNDIEKGEIDLEKRKADLKRAEDALHEFDREYESWKETFPYRNKNDLRGHAKNY